MCVVKCCKDKNIDLLFIGEIEKKHYFLIKDLTHSCMITHYIAEKKVCCYCLQTLWTEDVSKCHIKNCFKINCKQKIKMSKSKYLRFSYYEKNEVTIYDLYRKQNPNESYTNKYQ